MVLQKLWKLGSALVTSIKQGMSATESAKLDSTTVAAGIANGASSEAMPNGQTEGSKEEFAQEIQQKYAAEREKRLRAEGNAQYLELEESEKFSHLQDDPWVDLESPIANAESSVLNGRCKIFISGAGIGGLLYAVRLIEAGIDPRDIRLADTAGGFGGTWYWNRYPGLMCDVESYIYMPLLEKMNYMPRHRYAYGTELRRYMNMIADRWDLRDKAMFQTGLGNMKWDEEAKEWIIDLVQMRKGREKLIFQIRSQVAVIASGVLNHPKIPRLPGLDSFQGQTFHTARWDYNYTGGSPEEPFLEKLRNKRVGIIGTGATAIQCVPAVAKYAEELYVFQRTPSSVDERGQRLTDPAQWTHEIASKPGWQQARNDNFVAHQADISPKPSANLVNDGWTTIYAYSAIVGGPTVVTPDSIPTHIANLHAIDLPRQERLRARVDAVVHDKETATKLKAWYPSWCKRPCFHDEYLQSFNYPNVHLIDTDGKGLDSLTPTAAVANGTEYPLDLLVFSTGYRTSGAGTAPTRANVRVTGRNSADFNTKAEEEGLQTLHGVMSAGFPNFFTTGPYQTGVSSNFSHALDQLAIHSAYIISEGMRKAGALPSKKPPHTANGAAEPNGISDEGSANTNHTTGKKFTIEPTYAATKAWTSAILAGAPSFAAAAGCTPSYINDEGAADRPKSAEGQVKAAQRAPWGGGIIDFVAQIEKWRGSGEMEGIEVKGFD